ncbi:MAG: membrane dipeptidase [Lysobacterales bacterium]|jgi:membrane dipeptidase
MALTRRDFLNNAAATAALAVLTGNTRIWAGNNGLYENSMIIDGLGFPGSDSEDNRKILTTAELEDIKASGLTAIHLTLGEVGSMSPLQAFEKIVRDVTHWDGQIAANPAVLCPVRHTDDLKSAKQAHRTGLIYGLQDGVAFEDDIDRIETLHRLGIRVIQPTYNRRNLLGDGCMEPANAGLSKSGFEAVAKMNEQGILVDLSHCGRRTAMDAISASDKPVCFTHTGCYALAAHPRHRTDKEIRAVAAGGGVIGIFIMPYLSKGKQPAAADVIRHLEYAVKIAGEDHVSVGTDGVVSPTHLTPEFIKRFRKVTRKRKNRGIAAPYESETGYLFAADLNTPQRFATLMDLLLQRGHSETRVRKILGGNLARLFGETWPV